MLSYVNPIICVYPGATPYRYTPFRFFAVSLQKICKQLLWHQNKLRGNLDRGDYR